MSLELTHSVVLTELPPKMLVATVLSKNVQCKFYGSEVATTSRRR